MGWADILGQALVGGAMGFTGSRADSLEKEEARAEEEAMMNLKRSWQVEDKLWDQRMADVQWGRQQDLSDRKHEQAKELRGMDQDFQSGLLEDKQEHDREMQKPSEFEQMLGAFGKDNTYGLLQSKYSGEKKDYQVRPQDYINAEENIDAGYTAYVTGLRGEAKNNPKSKKEWAKEEMPKSYGYVYGSSKKKGDTVKDAVDEVEDSTGTIKERLDRAMSSANKEVAVNSVMEGLDEKQREIAKSYLFNTYKK